MSDTMYASRDLDLINKLQQLFTLSRNAKRNLYDSWMRNYKLVNNRIGSVGGGSWYPAPRDSEIYPTLSAIAAWMTDQNTSIDIVAAADPNSPYSIFMQAVATDLSTVMQTNWTVDSEEAEVRMVVWDSFQCGAGFFKNIWDQALAGGLGNAKAIRVDPWSLYFDPNATSLSNTEYIIEVRRMSLDEIERRWPGSATSLGLQTGMIDGGSDEKPDQYDMSSSRVPKANPGALPQGNARWAAPSGRQPDGGQIVSPGIVVYEYWLKENDEYWESDLADDDTGLTATDDEKPAAKTDGQDDEKHVSERWRVVVVAGNQVLMDEWSDELTSYGSHPYERFVFEETGEMYGVALCDHLAQPQIYLNRLLTALQHNAELCGNPIFMENANSGLDRVNIINKPGQRLRLNGPAGLQQNRPEWLRPPDMPPGVSDLVQFWISRIENISGLSAAVKGGPSSSSRMPEGVVSTIQESAFVRIRAALSNMEDTLKNCAYKLAELIIDNYTEPRIVAIVGPQNMGKTAIALSSRHFIVPTHKGALPLKYSLVIQAGASMPTTRQARAAEADQAYALGIIDRQAWFEAHGTPNWPALLMRINKAIADGTFNPPGARQQARH